MITGEISFQVWAQDNIAFWKIRQKWLIKKSNLSGEKPHHEHKNSVTFLSKVGTKKFNDVVCIEFSWEKKHQIGPWNSLWFFILK